VDQGLIPVFIMNKRYEVPEGLTIMRALEHAGYRLVRGAGCRGGFCGACATTYRVEGSPRLHMALACQDLAVPNMHLVQLPYFPARKATYNLKKSPIPHSRPCGCIRSWPTVWAATPATRLPPGAQGDGVCGGDAARRSRRGRGALLRLRHVRAVHGPLPGGDYPVSGCHVCPPGGRPLRQSAAAASGRAARRAQRGKWASEVAGLTKLDADALKKLYAARDMETPTGGFAKAVGK